MDPVLDLPLNKNHGKYPILFFSSSKKCLQLVVQKSNVRTKRSARRNARCVSDGHQRRMGSMPAERSETRAFEVIVVGPPRPAFFQSARASDTRYVPARYPHSKPGIADCTNRSAQSATGTNASRFTRLRRPG